MVTQKNEMQVETIFHISVSDVNQWGESGNGKAWEMGKRGTVKTSLSKPRLGKILLNYIKI